jgi:hypothetical protein
MRNVKRLISQKRIERGLQRIKRINADMRYNIDFNGFLFMQA